MSQNVVNSKNKKGMNFIDDNHTLKLR